MRRDSLEADGRAGVVDREREGPVGVGAGRRCVLIEREQLSLAWVRTFTGPGHQGAAAVFAAGEDVWATTEVSESTTFGAGEPGEITIDAETVSVVHASLDGAGNLRSAKRSSTRTGGAINGGTFSGPVAPLGDGAAHLVGAAVVGTREFASGQPNATLVTAPQAASGSGSLSPQWSTIGRYDASGTLAWMHTITGSGHVALAGLSSFEDGAFVMAGGYSGSVSLGPSTSFSAASASEVPAFVARADAGGAITWASAIKGTAFVYGLDTDAKGPSYVGGVVRGSAVFGPGEANETTLSSSLPATVGAGFVARYAADGKLSWAKSVGDEVLVSAVVRTAGGLVVSGAFTGSRTVFGTARQAAGSAAAERDGFVAKLDEATGALVWFEQLTGAGDDLVDVLRVDPRGQVWALGWTTPRRTPRKRFILADAASGGDTREAETICPQALALSALSTLPRTSSYELARVEIFWSSASSILILY